MLFVGATVPELQIVGSVYIGLLCARNVLKPSTKILALLSAVRCELVRGGAEVKVSLFCAVTSCSLVQRHATVSENPAISIFRA